jgi:pimeloyl-ACP methyl ester carboxylesterase
MTERCNFVLVHGAFQGAFVWKFLKSKLETSGHSVWAPDLHGNSLSEHIKQISELLLKVSEPVILIGHSYGGLVITGVARKAGKNIRSLVYLDAPIPANPTGEDQSLFDILGPGAMEAFTERTINGFVEPFPAESFGLDPSLHSDIINLHSRQSIKCFSESGPAWNCSTDTFSFPVFYIQCSPNDFNNQQILKAQAMNWKLLLLPESGHCPMITHVDELYNLIKNSIIV